MTFLSRFVFCVITNRDTKCEAAAEAVSLVLVSVCLCKMFSLNVYLQQRGRDL